VQFLGAWISRCRQHGDREFVSLVDRHSAAADQGILCAGFCVCLHGGDVMVRVARLLAGVLNPRRHGHEVRRRILRNADHSHQADR